MPNQATVTGKTAGAIQVTTKLIANVSEVDFDIAKGILRIYQGGGAGEGQLALDIGLDSVTTVTCTVSGGTFAFTVS